ncbi:unnamed protein product [Darwinula stevensoni]|uniref:Uncharacterized protein n=1 Tax=Darwinula stevensoni TaxID=69355 RepID=A0A7R9FPL7_9CRUS|nr:unnamed protein product [Darwinula stevensoni]CAG0898110.1 unnamed protein product [Darwinula stevensoni]
MQPLSMGRWNGKDDGIKFPASNFPEEIRPNELVDVIVDLSRTIYEQIDNIAPVRTIEWPIVEANMSVPSMGLHFSLGITVRLTQCTLFGLHTGTRHGRWNGKDDGIKFPASNFPEEIRPNELVDVIVDLSRTIYEQIDNIAPVRTIEWPIVEANMSVPSMGLHFSLGIAVRLTQCTLFGLHTGTRHIRANIELPNSVDVKIAKAEIQALAVIQVCEVIQQYYSQPTSTLYTNRKTFFMLPPAFTICPRPSLVSSWMTDLDRSYEGLKPGDFWSRVRQAKNMTAAQVFLRWMFPSNPGHWKAIIPFAQIGEFVPEDEVNMTMRNGEVFEKFQNGLGARIYRAFYTYIDSQDSFRGDFFKCHSLFLNQDIFQIFSMKNLHCKFLRFEFALGNVTDMMQPIPPHVDVYIHDLRESYTNLGFFHGVQISVVNGSVVSVAIRPHRTLLVNRKDQPCSSSRTYSYSTCMERCFWNVIQTSPDVPCLSPLLLPRSINATKPDCRTASEEDEQLRIVFEEKLRLFRGETCNCPKNCHIKNYRVANDPNAHVCREAVQSPHMWPLAEGTTATLIFSFPSSRMPQVAERLALSVGDLLSTVGGIVGICLGASILSLFDILEQACLYSFKIVHRKIRQTTIGSKR